MKRKASAGYIATALYTVKSFLDFHEVPLNWKKLRSAAPVVRNVAMDRAPTRDEIRMLLEVCSARDELTALIMASGGLRVGALPGLRLKDFHKRASGIGGLRVYRGEPEEYSAFISRECVRSLEKYLDHRRLAGEYVTPDSPLLRDKWALPGHHRISIESGRGKATQPKAITVRALMMEMSRLWVKSGVRVKGNSANDRFEFKTVHGFRKFFKTQASRGIPIKEDVELLMGHYLNYYKPTFEHLEIEYANAEPYLEIHETKALEHRLKRDWREEGAEFPRLALGMLELRAEMTELSRGIERLTNVIQTKFETDQQ